MQGHGRIIAHDFCVAHREANSGLSTLNRTKSILSIYHQQRQLQKQRGMCLNGTYPFCQQPLSGNCHSICFSKPVLWTATPGAYLFLVCVGLFGGDHIVIDRLTAGEQGDLGVGTALGKELEGLLGLLLADVLAVEDVDEFGALLGLGLRQTAE